MLADCLFCKIVEGTIPCKKVFEDAEFFAFEDIDPKAPVHILMIAKKHHQSLLALQPEDAETMGKMMLLVAQLARLSGLEQNGFRTVINTGNDSGQSVTHLHIHILGGRSLSWPPG